MKRQRMNGVLTWGVGLAMALVWGVPAWAVTYEEDAQSLQTIKVFVNDSGAALTSGTAVVLNVNSTNYTTGTTKGASTSLGLLVTTTTVADSIRFVGIVADSSCADQSACRVITYGPALARFACSTDNTATLGAALGTAAVAGLLGSGTRAGLMLTNAAADAVTTSDNCLRWVFVAPSPAS